MALFESSQRAIKNPLKDSTQQSRFLETAPLNEGLQLNPNIFRASAPASVAAKSDNTLRTATNVASLNQTRRFNDFVGSTDTTDFYRIHVGANSNFNLSLTNINQNANIDVNFIRDANNNGKVDTGEIIASSTRSAGKEEALNLSGLAAGTYYVQVARIAGDSNYTLSLSNNNPSNLLLAEKSLTLTSNPLTFSGAINKSNSSDVYKFTYEAGTNLNVSLTGLSQNANDNADMRLIFDANNNGTIDRDEEITASKLGAGKDESINRYNLYDKGTYFIQVYQVSGATNYTLRFSNSTPSNLLPSEHNLGTLSSNVTNSKGSFDPWNTSELHEFTLKEKSNFYLYYIDNITESRLTPQVRLVFDSNRNSIVDTGEVVGYLERFHSRYGGSAPDGKMNLSDLNAGRYFVQVFGGDENAASSSYNMQLSTNKFGSFFG